MRTGRSNAPAPRFAVDGGDRWSGGGYNAFANAQLARELHPDAFDAHGIRIVMRNTVRPSLLVSGSYVYMPQNAWPWSGSAVGVQERARRAALRAASEVAHRRAIGTIRIGPMIPLVERSHPDLLPNVLDLGFEEALDESMAVAPAWIPSRPYALLPGSLWSYRNGELVAAAHERFLREGGDLDLLIVGSPGGTRTSIRLRELVGKSGSRVHVVAEHVERRALLAAIRGAWVCVLSSMVEASPVTLLECAALERPVICWDMPAYRHLAAASLDTSPDFVNSIEELAEAFSRVRPSVSQRLAAAEVRAGERDRWCADFVRACTDLVRDPDEVAAE